MGLKVTNVSKNFADKKAVDNISFSIDSPGVFGLLGTNGAGKTTTIRMMLGIIKKDNGEITWNGKEVTRKNVNFGYLPEERGIYPKSKIMDQLVYFAKLKGMKKQEAMEKIKYWAKRLEVEQYLEMPAEKLSKGNQQKVQFIIAVMHNPELIILDEPFSGLDPVNAQILKDVITDLVKEGKYIVMSSHQMTQIEEFCTQVVILNKGVTVLKGNLKEIKNSYPCNRLEISTKEQIDTYIEKVGLKVNFSKNNEYDIEIIDEQKAHELLKMLMQNNVEVMKFELKRPSLQDIFIEKVGEEKMRDLITVAGYTIKEMIKRKSFIISNIIILLIIVVGFNIPNIMDSIKGENNEELGKDIVLIVDEKNIYEGNLELLNSMELGKTFKIQNEAITNEEIKQKIDNEEIYAAMIISPKDGIININYLIDSLAMNQLPQEVIEAFSKIYTNIQIEKLGLSTEQLASLNGNFNLDVTETNENPASGNVVAIMLLSLVLFYAIYFCAYQVSSSITTEKTSKIMETLVTSTTPRTIVLGKTIGIGIVGLLQVATIILVSVISCNLFLDGEILSSIVDVSKITPLLAISVIVYFILGYSMYSLLYALTGSTVSKPEDINSANSPVAILAVIGFYLAYFSMMNPTSEINAFASMFPFSAPFSMPFRIMMGTATPVQIAISIGLMVVSIIVIAHISIKIYSSAILNYGTKMNVKDIFKIYKEKN